MSRFDNLRPDGALRWKLEDHRLERSGSVMWQAGTSKVAAPNYVSYGPMGWPCEQVMNILFTCWRYGPSKLM
jgi:hypothetical protein